MKFKQPIQFAKCLLLHFLTLASQCLFAQEEVKDSLRTQTVNEVVITATRYPIEKNKSPQNVDLIGKKDLKLTEGQEFADIIKKNSSVSIVQYPGLLSGIGIRGFAPQISGINQRNLLLVDGRPAGTGNLALINQSNIERVEILKGPASALYGPQAMGGVVNIITKKSTGPISPFLFAEYGSFKTVKIGGGVGGNITSKVDYDLSFNIYDRGEDYRLGNGNVFRDMMASKNSVKSYSDGRTLKINESVGDGNTMNYTKVSYKSGSARVGYALTKNLRIDVKGEKFVANDVQSPSDITASYIYPGLKDLGRNNGEVMVSGTVNRHDFTFKVFGANESTEYKADLNAKPYTSYHGIAQWAGFQLRDNFKLFGQSLIVGLDHTKATSKSRAYSNDSTERAPYSPNYSHTTTGLYAQGQINLMENKLLLTPGIRLDQIAYNVQKTPLMDNVRSGKESNAIISPSISAIYQLINPLKLHASLGRGYVTPDAYNVAGYSIQKFKDKHAAVTKGNPNLKNENSWTWDAGIRLQNTLSGISADLTYFSTIVRDRISTETTPATGLEFTNEKDTIQSYTTYINANKGKINGVELELGYDFGALNNYKYSLRLFLNNTSLIKAKEITVKEDKETEKDIYNVAKTSTTCGIDFNNLKGLNLRVSGRYIGNKKDIDFNDFEYPEIQYPKFMILDVTAAYTFQQKHTLTVFLNNITDENYYEKRGYNMPGRNVSVRYSFSF